MPKENNLTLICFAPIVHGITLPETDHAVDIKDTKPRGIGGGITSSLSLGGIVAGRALTASHSSIATSPSSPGPGCAGKTSDAVVLFPQVAQLGDETDNLFLLFLLSPLFSSPMERGFSVGDGESLSGVASD